MKRDRIFGLDIFRSLAILLVLFIHTRGLLPFELPAIFSVHLPDGVDLFFVLSGYLIGRQLITTIEKNETYGFRDVITFLKRRWFRTLPNYYLFLLINILLVSLSLTPGTLDKLVLPYFVFMQNFHKPYDVFFWESWSLAVEEWFYLVFPFVLFIIGMMARTFKMKKKYVVYASIFLLLTIPLCIRMYMNQEPLDWDLFFRKLVITRLDTIAFGILGAAIHFYKPSFWKKSKYISLAIGIILSGLFLLDFTQNEGFKKTFYYSIVGFTILLFIPFFASLQIKYRSVSIIRMLSKVSFSLYLTHIPVMQLLDHFTPDFDVSIRNTLIFCLTWIVSIALSYVIYRFYERPMTALRDR
jgi:peptidoglycan/LPS O-acetylase OafA/YrhL